MSTPSERAQGIGRLQRRCRELGLNENQSQLLVKLSGWNKETTLGELVYYYGSSSNPAMKEILQHLLGTEELQKLKNNPLAAITGLYPQLHTSPAHLYAGMWLLAQLSIRPHQPWARQSIEMLAYRPPEEMQRTVAFAIEQLLQRP